MLLPVRRLTLAVLALAIAAAAALVPPRGARASLELRTASISHAGAAAMGTIPGEIVVQFRTDTDERTARRAIHEAGGGAARQSAFGQRWLVSMDHGLTSEFGLDYLRRLPEVDYAEPNGRVRAFGRPNDRLYDLQWHMKMLNVERTWDIQTGDPSVVVAVLDTGIAYEDFGPFRKAPDWGSVQFVRGYNVFNGSSNAHDDNFHGTHVASTIAEATNNGVGVTGLCHNCALMSVKVLDANGDGTFFGVAEGIDYATGFNEGGRRVKVINMSLGGSGSSQTVRQAVDRAFAGGIVLVAAAGNDGEGTLSFPAVLSNVIAVGAVDGRKRRAPYSNFGAELDLVAPGGDLSRDDDRDGYPDGVLQQTFDPDTAALEGRYDDFAYFFVSGTSEATPHVAALAALLVRQGITDPGAVKAAIEQTAEDLGDSGRDDQFGHGLIRPAEALKGLGFGR